jgi:predicted amidophosphoribosyltransferase
MMCPTCAAELDDALDFAQAEPLRCPCCGRRFTNHEIDCLPLSETLAILTGVLPMAQSTTVIAGEVVTV